MVYIVGIITNRPSILMRSPTRDAERNRKNLTSGGCRTSHGWPGIRNRIKRRAVGPATTRVFEVLWQAAGAQPQQAGRNWKSYQATMNSNVSVKITSPKLRFSEYPVTVNS